MTTGDTFLAEEPTRLSSAPQSEWLRDPPSLVCPSGAKQFQQLATFIRVPEWLTLRFGVYEEGPTVLHTLPN
jgi:hypothetical protein